MMKRKIDFFFDFGSAPSYLAHTQLPGLASRTGVEVAYRPFLLGGVFKETGNTPPGSIPGKFAWFKGDMALFAQKYGVPLTFPDVPISNTIVLMRGALVARELGCFGAYCDAMFKAIWVNGRNIQEEAIWVETLTETGFEADTFVEGIHRREIKDQLIANTQEAIERGIFGAPTFFAEGSMFFGQDRLDFVEQAVTRNH